MSNNFVRKASVGAAKYASGLFRSYLMIILALMWFPMIVLVILSFSERAMLSFPPETLTLRWYFEVFTDPQALPAIFTSLRISLIATPITLLIALLFVYGLDRLEFRWKPTALFIVILPLVIPGVVGGIAVYQFSEFLGIRGFATVVLVHVIVTIPFGMLVLLDTLSKFDRSLERAALDLGANELTTFFRVTLPNIYRGVVAAALLVFSLSFNEFLYTYFVRGNNIVTLPIFLWSNTAKLADPIVYAVSVVFILTATTVLLLTVAITSIRRVSQF